MALVSVRPRGCGSRRARHSMSDNRLYRTSSAGIRAGAARYLLWVAAAEGRISPGASLLALAAGRSTGMVIRYTRR